MHRWLPLAVLAAAGCGSDIVLELRYPSENMRAAVTELEAYVFDGQNCERFDPHGAPFADAPTRGEMPALFSKTARRDETFEDFSGLSRKQYAVVIDGYGPGCIKDRSDSNGETECTEFDTSERRVHRVHGCAVIEGETDAGNTLVLTLLATAPIGSTMKVEELGVTIYNAEYPLPVTGGLVAREPFVVQLVDENRENLNDALVHWRVSKGSGFIEETQPAITAAGKYDTSNQTDVEADGLAFGTVHAGSGDAGSITVEAYAPGFENSPAVFEARTLPETDIEVSAIRIDPAMLDLSDYTTIRPVLVTDVDEDGLADVVISSYERGDCNNNRSQHRIAVIFGDGVTPPVISARSEGLLYSMVYANADGAGRRRLLAFAADPCRTNPVPTPDGMQSRVRRVAVEAWSLSREEVAAAGRLVTETSSLAPNNARAIEKIAISADVADLNPGDGIDEIAVSRCSYSAAGGFPINCQSPTQSHHDGEVAVMRPIFVDGVLQEMRLLSVLAAAQTTAGAWAAGGFGEVRFVDLNNDNLPDLVWTRPELVLAICAANRPETGYELGNKNRIFQQPANLSWGYSLGVGHFTSSSGRDVVVSGGGRAVGRVSGATLLESTACLFNTRASDVVVGVRVGNPDGVLVRVADINEDDFDDAVVLHRSTGEIHTYLGSGTLELATGPVVELDDGGAAGFSLGFEGPENDRKIVAVTYAPRENRLMVAKFQGRVLR